MEYILFIHNNADAPASAEQWDKFIKMATQSGLFNGGSEIGHRYQIGEKAVTNTTIAIGGYMKFESDDINKIYQLLEHHPVAIQGGTLELCELPLTR